jgi:hypothetical protein
MTRSLADCLAATRAAIAERKKLAANERTEFPKPPTQTPIRFSIRNSPVRSYYSQVVINTYEKARLFLERSGLLLGPDGLPFPETGTETEARFERASKWINRDGNLIDVPKSAKNCFGLPRYARSNKCPSCKDRTNCQLVVDARLTFGGRKTFQNLSKNFDFEKVALLACISALKGWEHQLSDLREVKRRMYAAAYQRGIRESESKLAKWYQDKSNENRIKNLNHAAMLFSEKSIEPKLARAASSELTKDHKLRRCLTDQLDVLKAVWHAESAANIGNQKKPGDRGYVSEITRLYQMYSGDSRGYSTIRSAVKGALKALERLRSAGVKV